MPIVMADVPPQKEFVGDQSRDLCQNDGNRRCVQPDKLDQQKHYGNIDHAADDFDLKQRTGIVDGGIYDIDKGIERGDKHH